MAGRTPKPWFRASRGEWYVQIKGETHRLGPDEEEANRKFHLLMAGETPEPEEQNRDWLFASEVADRFLSFLKEERSSATLHWYWQYLGPFRDRFMMMRSDAMSRENVKQWVNSKWPTAPSRRAALRSVKAAFRWAVDEELIPYSCVASMRLPGQEAREHFASRDDFKAVLAAVKDKSLADLIKFIWLTGARPQEVTTIEWPHVDLKNRRIVLPPKLVKGKKKVRVIYLSPEALKLVKSKKGEGKLFKTLRGKPYSKDIVRSRFKRLEKKVGFRFCMYHFRHGFAHRSMAAGNDVLTVSTLLGNSPQTLSRVYAHMNQADQHLRAALKKTK